MKKVRLAQILLLSILFGCAVKENKNSDLTKSPGYIAEVAAIKHCFNSFKSAIINANGEKAIEFVDENTHNYAIRILDLTKTADRDTFNELRLIDKMVILIIRHQSTIENILEMQPETFFSQAMQNGLVGQSTIKVCDIGEVVISGDKANAEYLLADEYTNLDIGFTKEGGYWKIDINSILPFQEESFLKMIESYGKVEAKSLLRVLETFTGKRPSHNIWDPIVPDSARVETI